MHIAIAFANTAWYASGDGAVSLAVGAEAVGVESLWTVEHVVVPVGYESTYPYDVSGRMPGGREDFDIPDPLIWLSYIAARTSRIKLATGVMILPQRNPIVVAKEVATLDAMSGGRAVLGVGVGWLAEEFAALGVPFNERGKRTDEYIAILRALWSGEAAEFHGEFFDFGPCHSRPTPVAKSVPIVIGGHTEIAARRAGKLGDGFFPGSGTIEELTHLIGIVRATAQEHGRDPDAIEITTGAIARGAKLYEHIEAIAKLGVKRIVLAPSKPGDFSQAEDLVTRFSDL